MWSIIALMLGGIGLGLWSGGRPGWMRVFPVAGRVQQVGTVILLFAMGLWLGANKEFWDNLSQIGVRGVLFALAAVVGSVLCTHLLVRLAFGGKDT